MEQYGKANERTTAPTLETPAREGTGRKDVFIHDPVLGKDPNFERRQREYIWIAEQLPAAFEKGENIVLNEEQKEILERFLVLISILDTMIDDQKLGREQIVKHLSEKSAASENINKAIAELQTLIERNGNYKAHMKHLARAISYSGKESLQDRHREALYLGRAIAEAIEPDGPRQKHLAKVLGVLVSFGSFSDDVVDYKDDGRSAAWARERARATVRVTRDLYGASGNANAYMQRILAQAFSYYGRKTLHKLLGKKDGG